MSTCALIHRPEPGPPDRLYLLFHGVGSTAEGMLPLARRLIAEFPQAAVLCLDAPERFDAVAGDTDARQWFSIRRIDESERGARVAAALTVFVATVRAMQRRFDMTWERTALAGFSQGALMALEAVQIEPKLAGHVLAFSGRHAATPTHAPLGTTVHLLHGSADTVIPATAAIDSAQTLIEFGADATADMLPGIGHDLHVALIDRAIERLRTFLPKRSGRSVMPEAPQIDASNNGRLTTELGEYPVTRPGEGG